MTDKKLVKPCPLCRSNKVIVRPIIGPHGGAGGAWQMFCTKCGTTMLSPQVDGREGAISFWNYRQNWRNWK